jgi:hypothetical protein
MVSQVTVFLLELNYLCVLFSQHGVTVRLELYFLRVHLLQCLVNISFEKPFHVIKKRLSPVLI